MLSPNQNVFKAIYCLICSAFLFSLMGVCIRYASYSVDNSTIVFFRNFIGLFIFLPFIFKQGLDFIKTDKIWMHAWRAVVGLTAMYGFFYAIANLKLSNAMVFSYSSPIFIPIIAWLFLKEKITQPMIIAALVGLIGVLFVAKPDQGIINQLSIIGMISSVLAATAFVTVRALTSTESPERIVFYFCFFGTLISIIPMFWLWRPYTLKELGYLICAGILANISQIFMSNAYKFAPAGQIGPINYIAIIFAGVWGFLFWAEIPDVFSMIGFSLIIIAIILSNPTFSKRLFSNKSKFRI